MLRETNAKEWDVVGIGEPVVMNAITAKVWDLALRVLAPEKGVAIYFQRKIVPLASRVEQVKGWKRRNAEKEGAVTTCPHTELAFRFATRNTTPSS